MAKSRFLRLQPPLGGLSKPLAYQLFAAVYDSLGQQRPPDTAVASGSVLECGRALPSTSQPSSGLAILTFRFGRVTPPKEA
jgi:hypothetical protein